MPRSYSFEHYTALNPERSRGVREQEKQHVAQQAHADVEAVGGEKIHYGKRHAQTEELFAARAMNRQLEGLAGVERLPPKRAEAPRPPQEPELKEPQLNRGTPIGALPELQEAPEPGLFRELYDEAGRHLRVVRMAARDIGRASWRLVSLPLQVARLAARKIRHRYA